MKKIGAIMLALMLCVNSMLVLAEGMKFTDVSPEEWYYNDVKTAVESGLVNGKSETEYCPEDNLTYGEAIKLAACMNQLYLTGEVTLKAGSPWYKPFVDYCVDNKIVVKEYDYEEFATRAGYMQIFARALPEEGLQAINSIPDDSIPDVPSSASYGEAIYRLYRAGIVTGVDEAHNCDPEAFIKRSEVAAILTRMMNEEKRVKFSMGPEEPTPKPSEEPTTSPSPVPSEEPTASPSPAPTEDPKGTENENSMVITKQPESASLKAGETAVFSVEVQGGTEPYTYEWQYLASRVKQNEVWEKIDDKTNGTSQIELESVYGDWSANTEIRCVVKDADDQIIMSQEAALKYAGSDKVYNELTEDRFLLYVDDVYTITDRGTVITGKVLSGKICVGDGLQIVHSDGTIIEGSVAGIEMFRKALDSAEKGNYVGLLLNAEITKDMLSVGDAVIAAGSDLIAANRLCGTLTLISSEEGGRKTAIAKNDKGQFYFVTDFTGRFADLNGEEVAPGATRENVAVVFPKNAGVWYVGQEFSLREGGRTIGSFTVTEVIPEIVFDTEEAPTPEESAPLSVQSQTNIPSPVVGEKACFSVVVSGGKAPYTYLWYISVDDKAFEPILEGSTWAEGITGSELTIDIMNGDLQGHYQYLCIIQDAEGSTTYSDKFSVV